MPWFDGQPLLGQLEDVHIASDRNLVDNRFPVQYVIRPQSAEYRDYRGFAGSVVGGIFKQGDEVMVLPSRKTSTIAAIDTPDGAVDQAFPPMAVTMLLDDELDISRGDMICRPTNQPSASHRFEAMICWFDETSSLRTGRPYQLKHTTRWIARRGRDAALPARRRHAAPRPRRRDARGQRHRPGLDPHHLAALLRRVPAQPRPPAASSSSTPRTNLTVAAGMIIGAGGEPRRHRRSVVAENIAFHPSSLSREERREALGTNGATIWMTGLSGSGKSTIAAALEHTLVAARPPRLHARRRQPPPRPQRRPRLQRGGPHRERAPGRRGGEAAGRRRAWSRSSRWSAPSAAARDQVRAALHEAAGIPFFEVFVDTPLEECERRDPKGLYAKARAGRSRT